MKILVVGPQRSGSTFISHCLSSAFSIPHIDEMEFDVYYVDWFFKIVENKESWVVHAPALFTDVFKILDKFPDVTFVIVKRPIDEIVDSQKRIKWTDEHERRHLNMDDNDIRHVCEVKYMYWEKWKQYFPSWVEYDYRDFELHPFWVSKENRHNFTSKQWKR